MAEPGLLCGQDMQLTQRNEIITRYHINPMLASTLIYQHIVGFIASVPQVLWCASLSELAWHDHYEYRTRLPTGKLRRWIQSHFCTSKEICMYILYTFKFCRTINEENAFSYYLVKNEWCWKTLGFYSECANSCESLLQFWKTVRCPPNITLAFYQAICPRRHACFMQSYCQWKI